MSKLARRITSFCFRQITALTLLLALTALLVPTPTVVAAWETTEQKLSVPGRHAWSWLTGIMGSLGLNASNAHNQERRGVAPPSSPTKAEREARVASLEVNPVDEVLLKSREPLFFTAVPLNQAGEAIHGLLPDWSSSDKQVIFVRPNGQAIAGRPGKATVTARVGNKQRSVKQRRIWARPCSPRVSTQTLSQELI